MLILLLAALPTALYSWLLWRLDQYEQEPLHLLAVAFLWGAAPALVLALVAEVAFVSLALPGDWKDLSVTVIAPLVEEPIKALALIGLFLFNRREFNGLLDGITYGALIGFGFAMTENMLYFSDNEDQLAAIWVLRSVIFGFNHAFFTSIVGITLGLVRLERRRWIGYAAVPMGLGCAILLHGIHNTSIQFGLFGLGLAWLADWGGVLVVLVVALLAQRHERRWVHSELETEVADGVVSAADIQTVAQPSHRFRLELRSLLRHGWFHFQHRRRFHHLLIELAFTKYQLRHGDRFCCQDDVDRLRAAVVAERRLIREL